MKKIIITGASGLVGSTLINSIIDKKKNFFDNKNISFKEHYNWIKKYHRNKKKNLSYCKA